MIHANSMTVTEIHWFERRGDLKLKMLDPEAVDGCGTAVDNLHGVKHAHIP